MYGRILSRESTWLVVVLLVLIPGIYLFLYSLAHLSGVWAGGSSEVNLWIPTALVVVPAALIALIWLIIDPNRPKVREKPEIAP